LTIAASFLNRTCVRHACASGRQLGQLLFSRNVTESLQLDIAPAPVPYPLLLLFVPAGVHFSLDWWIIAFQVCALPVNTFYETSREARFS